MEMCVYKFHGLCENKCKCDRYKKVSLDKKSMANVNIEFEIAKLKSIFSVPFIKALTAQEAGIVYRTCSDTIRYTSCPPTITASVGGVNYWNSTTSSAILDF